MKIEINLENYKSCVGCPLLSYFEWFPGSSSGYYECTGKWSIQEVEKDIPEEEEDIVRPAKCIEENGL